MAESEETRRDLRIELSKLETLIAELKVRYEQYFTGLHPFAPDKEHQEVKRTIRMLMKAPFRTSALNFRLRNIVQRYQSLDTYWRRVLKEREEGTYSKDVFKANLRERNARDDELAQTATGAAEKRIHTLFSSYREAIEKTTGRKLGLEYDQFRKSLVERSKELREKNPGKKISFKVTVKGGRVSLQANVRE